MGKQEGARGLVCRDIQGPHKKITGGRREALQGRLHPAKEKTTQEEVQEKIRNCTENSKRGRRGGRDRCFRRSTAKVEGLEKTQRNIQEHKT